MVAPTADALLNPHAIRLRRRIESFQWATPQEVREMQWRRLGDLLEHAYETVPYYRRVLTDLGLQPRDLGPGNYHVFPVLTKRILRQQFPQGLTSSAADPDRLSAYQTAGTTAAPVNFHLDPAQAAFDRATLRWLDSWAGVGVGDRLTHVQKRLKPRSWQVRLWRAVAGTDVLPAEVVLSHDGAAVAGALNRRRPDVIMGHPSMLRLAALALRASGLRLDFRPRAVIYHSEEMDQPTRVLVAQVFGAPLHTRYGASEFACWVAQSCPQRVARGEPADQNLHVHALRFLVEIVGADGRPAGPGEAGRLVITDLGNRVMPLLRYDLGDSGVMGDVPCSCGRGLPVLRTLLGRTVEYVVLPSGRRFPGRYLSRSFRGDALWEYQVIQPERGRLVALVVPFMESYGQAEARKLAQGIKDTLGESIEVEVRVVAEIPREPSGKKPFLKPVPGEEAETLLGGV